VKFENEGISVVAVPFFILLLFLLVHIEFIVL